VVTQLAAADDDVDDGVAFDVEAALLVPLEELDVSLLDELDPESVAALLVLLDDEVELDDPRLSVL